MEETKTENEEITTATGDVIFADEREDLAVNKTADVMVTTVRSETTSSNQRSFLRYLALPWIFVTVALLGGLRLGAVDASFVFLTPALLCLIFAAILLALFFRAGLIQLDGWFAEDFPILKNVANGAVLIALFAASAQLFNSLLPEQGLPFWVVGFCFFWTLWNNLFSDFDTKKLLRSLGALFGLAFVVKYLVLANLTAPASESWLRGIFENPAKEAFTWALDLPRFSAGTGYIQFFAIAFYLLGLFLLPTSTRHEPVKSRRR
ncbi:MAG: hypothetical protein ABI857_04965 [Acidobacteriota bacterium]